MLSKVSGEDKSTCSRASGGSGSADSGCRGIALPAATLDGSRLTDGQVSEEV